MDRTGGDVLVIGDLMVDVVAHHRDPIAVASDTAAQIRLVGGGSAANTAAWLAALGERPRLLAAVGDDALGRRAVDELSRGGVTFAGPILAGETTGTCVVLVGPDRERSMLPDRGANDRLSVSVVSESLRRPAGWVHLSGYTLLGDGSRAAGRSAVSAALAAGCQVSVDAASAAPLRSLGAPAFLDWIDGVSVVFANEAEAEALGGVAAVLARVGSVVVKRGSKGATWVGAVGSVSAHGLVVELVDSTGAGDAFAAGWIAARHGGQDVEGALAAAVVAGSRAVGHEGARPPPHGDGTRPG